MPRHRHSILASLGVIACLAMLAPTSVAAADPVAPITAPHANDRVLITWATGAGSTVRSDAFNAVRALTSTKVSPLAGAPLSLTLPRGLSVELAIKRLSAIAGVATVEPDYLMTTDDTSNDPKFTGGQQWDMYGDSSSPSNQYGSGAAEAWAAGYTGSRNIYVGVIDEGVQYTHPDLAANIWTNPWDPPDGIDNDGNGYVDDTHGWDFFNKDSSVYDGSTLSPVVDAHGTHVSGTIGAVGGNGTGIAGVNWKVTIIPTKFLGPNGGYVSDAISALDYLTDLHNRHGLDIVATNNSWGGGSVDPLLQAAIKRAGDAGMLFVAAAGNDSANNDGGTAFPSSLTCTTHADGTPRGYDCVIAVASIDKLGNLSSFSNYGATTVDLGAPGSDVVSTVPINSYASYSGTSMATPHVTGALALCASIGGLRGGDLRAALMNSTTPTPSLDGKTVSGGRLDIGKMVAACQPSGAPVSGAPSNLTATAQGPHAISLGWIDGAQGETAYQIQRAPGVSGVCGSFSDIAEAPAGATAYTADSLEPANEYCFRVRASNDYDGGTFTAWSNNVDTTTAVLPTYVCLPATYSWVDATATGYALADDDQVEVNLPSGFAFNYYGTPMTWIDINSNGYLDMGTANAAEQPWVNTALPAPDQPTGIAAPWWDDLNPGGATNIFTQTVGVAPHRTFVVEWNNVPPFTSPAITNGVTFEALLEEGTGAITFAYQDVTSGVSGFDYGAGATIGLEDQTGASGTQIGFNQAVLTANSAYRCTTDGSSPPDSTPPSTVTPQATLLAPQTLGTTATVHLNWAPSADASGITSYDLQYSKAGGTWTTVALGSPTATSADLAVAPGKSYSFRLRAHDGAGNVGAWASSAYKVNLLQEGAAGISYTGVFKLSSLTGASGSHVRQTGVAGRAATLTFTGSNVAFVSTLAPARGIATIWLDGVLQASVDLYSPTLKTKRVVWSAAVGGGTHTLEVRVTGTRNASSTSSRVDVDAFLVQQ